MRKISLVLFLVFVWMANANAQSIIENFESNSLNWNETAETNDAGNAIIDK